MSIADAAKGFAIILVVSIVQVSLLSTIRIAGGFPQLLLVTVVAVSLLRGSVFGAAAGFVAGLIVDTATLETLGLTSLLLTVGGYWIGRYGETTGRDRTHAPYVSVAVVTIVYAVGAMLLHVMLGDAVSARLVLIDSLLPTIAFNLILTAPVYLLVRRLLRPADWRDRAQEVRLLG